MKKKKGLTVLSFAMAAIIGLGAFSGCSSSASGSSSTSDDTSQAVNLSLYLWGGEGLANKDILAAINQKLKKDLNTTLTVKYIDWGDVATKYPLLFASGEQFDMAYVASGATVPYSTLASQGSLTDITGMLNSVPKLKAEITSSRWNDVKVNGKIYAVPNMYTEYTPYGFVYRDDLLKKYGLSSINSISSMEAYMDAVVKNEKFTPFNGDSADAENLYQMFVGSTGSWITAPGLAKSDYYLVGKSASDYKNVISPVFTQEFEDWAVKMNEWANKGYWPKDILSAQKGAKENFENGLSGGYITHMSDWTGDYGTVQKTLPGVTTSFWSSTVDNNKIMKVVGNQAATAISKNSKYPVRALKVIEKFMTDESYYDLLQYGIKGRQYEVQNNQIVQPASYDKTKDAGGFSAWGFRNDRFNIPLMSEDPRRYELIKQWSKTAINNPYGDFNFDTSSVSSQLSSVANVNATLGTQILLGRTTTDPKTAVAQYRAALKSAGIDDIIAAVKKQLDNYKPQS